MKLDKKEKQRLHKEVKKYKYDIIKNSYLPFKKKSQAMIFINMLIVYEFVIKKIKKF